MKPVQQASKPIAESCLENQQVILQAIMPRLADKQSVLEIGSGTGQHAVYFARAMGFLAWQTSDIEANHPGIKQWIEESRLSNVLPPLILDVSRNSWPERQYDAVFTANTLHIMHWNNVEDCFSGVAEVLKNEGLFLIYGPFNYNGQYTSVSNERFDNWLKSRDPESGIRDFEALHQLAAMHSMHLLDDIEMPVNNRILVWQKKVSLNSG